MLTMLVGSGTRRTERGTTVPTLSEKFTLLTRGALLCANMVDRICVRCSIVSDAEALVCAPAAAGDCALDAGDCALDAAGDCALDVPGF